MKIIHINILTPAKENIRGTSALPYHLLKERDENINVELYTFNNNNLSYDEINKVSKELNIKINLLKIPSWIKWVFRFHLLFLRIFLKYPIHHYITVPQNYVNEIKSNNPDLIWVYGAELSKVVKQFDGYKRIHTLPDSEALYYHRMLSRRFVINDWKKFWRCVFMYPKFLNLEKNYDDSPDITYHLVGEEDVKFLKNLNPKVNAKFLRHPHYEVRDNFNKDRHHENFNENETHTDNKSISKKFHSPKIKLLIAGQYNLYMKQEADLLIEQISANDNFNVNENRRSLAPSNLEGELRNENENSNFNVNLNFNEGDDSNDKSKHINPRNLCNPCEIPENTKTQSTSEAPIVHSLQLKKNYAITFLGKGWEKHVEDLRKVGFEVNHIKFAPDYIEEICKHDIQITPIAIGTGTKGKVLDALANGLLVIGTTYALENIAVKHGESCIEYHYPTEVIDILNDIPNNLYKYERMAEAGRQAVLKYHNRRKISSELFGG